MGIPVYLVEAWADMGAIRLPGEKRRNLGGRDANQRKGARRDGGRAVRHLKGAIEALSAVIEIKVDAISVVRVYGRSEEV
jgi:hypothetical protein